MTIAAGKRKRLQTGHCYMFADAPQWQCGQRKEHPGEWVLVKLTPRSKKLGVAQAIANVPPHDVVCVMAYESNPERFLFLAVERERVKGPAPESETQKGGHIVRLLGEAGIRDLSVDQVASYCRNRLDEGAARETVRKELVVLRLSLSHARDRGVMDRDPESVIPKFRARYKPRRRWMSTVELRGLLRHLSPERQRWVIVAVMTGGRLSEIEGLTWGDLDFANQQIHIRGTKTDRSDRIIPMDRELGELLGQMRKGDSEAVAGGWSNVRRDLEKACAKAKIEPVTPNGLRRTFASYLKQAGRDSLAVGKLLGHTSSRMVELVYGHLDQRSLRHAMEALPSVQSLISPSAAADTHREDPTH